MRFLAENLTDVLQFYYTFHFEMEDVQMTPIITTVSNTLRKILT
jgi:hypothetical protein